MMKVFCVILAVTAVSFCAELTRPISAGKCAIGQINSDNDAQQFFINGETGKLYQLLYDSTNKAYLREVPALTEDEIKNRVDIKPKSH